MRMKRITVALSFLLFVLAAIGPALTVGHNHHGQADHKAMHSSLSCAWMCAASTFVDSPIDPAVDILGLGSVAEIPVTEIATRLFLHNLGPRAPPSLSYQS